VDTAADLHDSDPGVRENINELRGELSCSVTNHESKVTGSVAEAHQEVAGLLDGPAPVKIGSGDDDAAGWYQ